MKSKTIKANCPKCDRIITAKVLAEETTEIVLDEDEDADLFRHSHRDEFRILSCPACMEVFFQHVCYRVFEYASGDKQSEIQEENCWAAHYKKQKRRRPEWLYDLEHVDLITLLRDTYELFDHGFKMFAAIGIRTIFECACRHLEIEVQGLGAKPNELEKNRMISEEEKCRLNWTRKKGNSSVHEGDTPTDDELDVLFLIMENFLYTNFVVRNKLKASDLDVVPAPKLRLVSKSEETDL